MNSLSIKHRGCTFFGSSEESIKEMIQNWEFKRSIFYKSSVYNYSCFARLLEDKSVEFHQFYNNGDETQITSFKDKKEFWDNL